MTVLFSNLLEIDQPNGCVNFFTYFFTLKRKFDKKKHRANLRQDRKTSIFL